VNGLKICKNRRPSTIEAERLAETSDDGVAYIVTYNDNYPKRELDRREVKPRKQMQSLEDVGRSWLLDPVVPEHGQFPKENKRRSSMIVRARDVWTDEEVDISRLIKFAQAWEQMGSTVSRQLIAIMESPEAEVNPRAISEAKDFIGGFHEEIDAAIAEFENTMEHASRPGDDEE